MEELIKLKSYKHLTKAAKHFHGQNMAEAQKFGETFESFCEDVHTTIIGEPEYTKLPLHIRALCLHITVNVCQNFGIVDADVPQWFMDYFTNKYYSGFIND
jgi:hypothetical protein